MPDIFEQADAATLLPENRLSTYKHGPGRGSVSAFANLFRYRLLEAYGDWWIDTDVLCRKSDWPEAAGKAIAGYEEPGSIAAGVLALPPDLASLAADYCERLGEAAAWGEGGPLLVTRILQDHRLTDGVLESSAFYPIHYRRWTDAFDIAACGAAEAACSASMAVHLWHEKIRRSGIDKSWHPPRATLMGRAIERHRTSSYFRAFDEADYQRRIEEYKRMSESRLRRT